MDKWLAGDAYEAFMGRWSRSLSRAFVEWLSPKPAADWLEIGCGTGALTSSLLEHCAPASVVACDPSAPFVEHAREALPDARVTFVVAGSDALPSREGGFDLIVSGLALNFLPNVGRALGAMRERLRAGGCVAAYVWDYQEGMEFLRCFWEEAVASDPGAASLDEGRRFPLCQPAELAAVFRAAGLTEVETEALQIATDFSDFADYWTPFLQGTGPAPSYVASLEAPSRERLRARLERRLTAAADGRIRLRARAWAVRGAMT
jgi:trans-aconitate methyltransferase